MRKQLKQFYRFCTNLIDPPFVILIYHRVTRLESDPQLLAVTPERFDAQLRHLSKNYRILSIPEFTEQQIHGRRPGKNSVVITFDDGYADNLFEAVPLLEKHRAQALFYISTSKIDTPYEFWWDDLERLLLTGKDFPPKLSLGSPFSEYDTSTSDARRLTYNALHPAIKNCPSEKRDALMEKIRVWSGLSREGRASHRILTRAQLSTLASSPSAVIGAHTHTHPKLSVCTPQEQREEILQSREVLEKQLGQTIDHFSYSFGSKDDFTKDTVAICRELGFKVVSANGQGPVHRWHNRYTLPRMLVRNWDISEFERNLRSFFHY